MNENRYELFLRKEGIQYDMSQLSSGETEIFNFLLGILSTNIRNGLIVIDEPELHLHPRWQKVLLELISDLEDRTGNQFIFTTHSPHFITEESISRVLRVYKDESDSSRLIGVEGSTSSDIDELVHIINSQNNEKMFFADAVVLVEGIKDRLVFQKFVEHYLDQFDDPKVIEVLEVNGKGNFQKYVTFLSDLDIPNYVIGDRGYARNIGGSDLYELFVTDESKIGDRVLADAESLDHQSLARLLDQAIESRDFEELARVRDLWEYIGRRLTTFKDDLSPEEEELWSEFLESQAEDGVYILPHGEIEDHLPNGRTSIEQVIELTREDEFHEWIESADSEGEALIEITEDIISSEVG